MAFGYRPWLVAYEHLSSYSSNDWVITFNIYDIVTICLNLKAHIDSYDIMYVKLAFHKLRYHRGVIHILRRQAAKRATRWAYPSTRV